MVGLRAGTTEILVNILVQVPVEDEFSAPLHAVFTCKPRICLFAEAGNKLNRHAAVGEGDNATNARFVGTERAFEDVRASGGVRNGGTERRGGGELRDNIKPLGVDEV
jgi:hypothetical protein